MNPPETAKYFGLDIGAETVKIAILEKEGAAARWTRRAMAEHRGDPRGTARELLESADYGKLNGGAASGRFASATRLKPVPEVLAAERGFRFLHPSRPATLVKIGGQGLHVLEMRGDGNHTFRQNSLCSQGTGIFLQKLTGRFGLSVEEADRLAGEVSEPAALSGRCPVILKTDMTHLANKGVDRMRILAGVFDAVAENVETMIKPASAPPDVFLAGGVARSRRIRRHFGQYLISRKMVLGETEGDEFLYYEALGAALEAAQWEMKLPPFPELFSRREKITFEKIPPPGQYAAQVTRLPPPPRSGSNGTRAVILGLDIGSTGSKAAAMDVETGETVWDSYRPTGGDPVGAAQALARGFDEAAGGAPRVTAFGVTGSGREIAGSMLSSCYGEERVFILNEIAAHAEGALYHDPEVDTIFEIGGQDSKYIRLSSGDVCDFAMNEACSAGTGSFIEEQGRLFREVNDVADMDGIALSAEHGLALGQHCSVFIAELVRRALAAGEPPAAVIAGLYDSIIQNYLNRVKGARSIGNRIFCQGMPFNARALAAAVARQTGRPVIVPPRPGLTGAIGIALLARQNIPAGQLEKTGLKPFLGARVLAKETFQCKATSGCGGSGNKCRIDRLKIDLGGKTSVYCWGGCCSLYDRHTRAQAKLPQGAPDPYRERNELMQRVKERVTEKRGRPAIGVTDEFLLKGLYPFFATFLRELGHDVITLDTGGQAALKKGIETCNTPFCAPVQLYAGALSQMAAAGLERVFLPMLRDLPRVKNERHATVCPLSQASADIFSSLLSGRGVTFIKPVLDMGPEGFRSEAFQRGLGKLAAALGAGGIRQWRAAYGEALAAQEEFDSQLRDIGRRAVEFARQNNLALVVMLGRSYTLYNDVLNSNVPRLLRELGAVALPADCYPVDGRLPLFKDIYWGYSQRNLRTAHQIRREPGHYSVFCSNYSCGPDSFNQHFFSDIMEGKPYAVIETDGHSGDAGTKTRLEAFLYNVSVDRRRGLPSAKKACYEFRETEKSGVTFQLIKEREDILLISPMGVNAPALAAVLRGGGYRAEALPLPDKQTLSLGRKYTSGKECLPTAVTIGSLLRRLEQSGAGEQFAFLMPASSGPCRFGVYHLFFKAILRRLGLTGKAAVFSPHDSDYFNGLSKGLMLKILAVSWGADLLRAALLDVRPAERRPGEAQAVFDSFFRRLLDLAEASDAPPPGRAFFDALRGKLCGVGPLLKEAAAAFAAIKDFNRNIPAVALVGEIFVRLEPFSNDRLIEKLEERGLKVKLAPFHEWLEYNRYLAAAERRAGRMPPDGGPAARFAAAAAFRAIHERLYKVMAEPLRWPPRETVPESLRLARPFLREEMTGEAVLTLGEPLQALAHGKIQGVVNVGPFECMPSKIADAQFHPIRERYQIPVLSVSLNGEPVDGQALDNFAYDIRKRHLEASMNAAKTFRQTGKKSPAALTNAGF